MSDSGVGMTFAPSHLWTRSIFEDRNTVSGSVMAEANSATTPMVKVSTRAAARMARNKNQN